MHRTPGGWLAKGCDAAMERPSSNSNYGGNGLTGSRLVSETFVSFCRWSRRFLPWMGDTKAFRSGKAGEVSPEFRDALTICGFDVEPWEVVLASYVAGVLAVVATATAGLALTVLCGGGMLALAFTVLGCGTAALGVAHLVSEYPKSRSRYLRIHSMGDIPEVVSYLVMSMKITPNMETAFRFAAESSDRAFARDMRRLLFDLSLRIHPGIDDAVSAFARLWGQWNDYLKRSI